MQTIKCLIIDDEELARQLLKTYIDKIDFLEVIAMLSTPTDAISIMNDTTIDLIFLDIQMPDIKGTDFAKMIPQHTAVIFTTAYSEYALEGFELNAVDYLLKPITFQRFLTAVKKVTQNTAMEDHGDSITVKSGYDLYRLNYDAILYIESDSEYVVFHTVDKKIMSYQTLKSLEAKLPSTLFMRVHRSFIVNIKRITVLKGKDIFIDDKMIPVSQRYYEAVKQLF